MANNSTHPAVQLQQVAADTGTKVDSEAFAQVMDERDTLAHLRNEFVFPKQKDGTDAIYLCGNSLGLLPKRSRDIVQQELQVWGDRAVLGHNQHPYGRAWADIDDIPVDASAKLVGAKPQEVAIMGGLTNNLHLLMVSFYRPTPTRYKILLEKKAFPSDTYAVASQLRFHGYDTDSAMIALAPREGEHTLRTEDILATIDAHGEEIALVMFPGIQYYTGQLFDIPAITAAGHAKGCYVGFDLAHAAGNVPLELHDWNVDFAAWCTYKYLNSGPGGIAGIYLHERHFNDRALPRFEGWWGNERSTRFDMEDTIRAMPGAAAYRLSNASGLCTASLLGSLAVFEQTSMLELRAKSVLLTGYLELLLDQLSREYPITIITPRAIEERGCQLSLLFDFNIAEIFVALLDAGLVCDKRKPNCIRLSPVPIYNSFTDVYRTVALLRSVLAHATTN